MYCKTCRRNVADAPYCCDCGTPAPPLLILDEEQRAASPPPGGGPPCPSCATASTPGNHFCTQCGAALPQVEEPAIPLDYERRAKLEHLEDLIAVSKKRGEYTRVIFSAREALTVAPGRADLHAEIAEAYAGKGEYVEAEEAIREAVRIESENPRYRALAKEYEALAYEQRTSPQYIMSQHPGDIAMLLQVIYTRQDEKWYKRGWANAIWTILGFYLMVQAWKLSWWILLRGPIIWRPVPIAVMLVCAVWMWIDAERNNKNGVLWFAIGMLTWPLGFLLYQISDI